jgi:hypothetical protein
MEKTALKQRNSRDPQNSPVNIDLFILISDDNDDKFSSIPLQIRTEIMMLGTHL